MGIYKSLNCGPGSGDSRKTVKENLKIISKKIGCKKNRLILINQIHSNKIFFVNKNKKKNWLEMVLLLHKKDLH